VGANKSFYEILAPYYNDIHHEALVRGILYLEKCFASLDANTITKKALDLGCGTGQLANYLYENGWDIHGVDGSVDMIRVLRSQYPFLSAAVADIRSLQINDAFDIVICVGDTMNHLLGDGDWLSLFRSVSKRLKIGGVFCFDVITPFDHTEVWPNSITVAERGDFTHIARGCVDEQGRPLLINTWFVKEGDRWQRYESKLLHRSYPLEIILRWLAHAELVNITVFDGDSLESITDKTTRWLIYASKQ
jgi:SAM-dependent methyltransferase